METGFELLLETTPFSIHATDPLINLPIGEDSIEFTHRLTPDALWDRYSTLSQFSIMKGEELEVVTGILVLDPS